MPTSSTYGQWDEAIKILKGLNTLTDRNMRIATNKNAQITRDYMKRLIRDQIPDWEPLSEKTIARKGSSKILINKGDLLNSINYMVVDSRTFFIGVPRSAPDKEGEPIVQIALTMEFGTRDGRIPPRPFVSITIHLLNDVLIDMWVNAIEATLNGKTYKPKTPKINLKAMNIG